MDKLTFKFIEIRNYLEDTIDDKLDTFLNFEYDPITIHVLSIEVCKVIVNDLHMEFPDYPRELLPKVKLKVDNKTQEIEKHVQMFFNNDLKLNLLASLDIGSIPYDLYYKKSYDLTLPYIFYARYDHPSNCIIEGSRAAVEEYFTGKCTPLSVAFQIAQEDGFL